MLLRLRVRLIFRRRRNALFQQVRVRASEERGPRRLVGLHLGVVTAAIQRAAILPTEAPALRGDPIEVDVGDIEVAANTKRT